MKQIKFWISIIVFGLLFTCSSNSVYSANAESKADRQKLVELVRAANSICPFTSGATRFDKVELFPSDEVGIFISYMKDTPLSKYSNSQLEALDKEPVRQQLISVVKSDSWSAFRTDEATFVISYSDRRGRELFRVKIYPEDYLTDVRKDHTSSANSNTGDRKKLVELVRAANNICPFTSGATRFDKVELFPSDEVGIFISYMKETPVSKYSDSQLASLDKEPVRQQLISVVKSDSWSALRAGEATFVISYSDRRGRELFRVKIYPEDYLTNVKRDRDYSSSVESNKGDRKKLDELARAPKLIISMTTKTPASLEPFSTKQRVKASGINDLNSNEDLLNIELKDSYFIMKSQGVLYDLEIKINGGDDNLTYTHGETFRFDTELRNEEYFGIMKKAMSILKSNGFIDITISGSTAPSNSNITFKFYNDLNVRVRD